MIKQQDNSGLRVTVIYSAGHEGDDTQAFIGQGGVVIDDHHHCPKVRLDNGVTADFAVAELEPEASPSFIVGGWAERTKHPYGDVAIGARRKVSSESTRGIKVVVASGHTETWHKDYCRPCDGPAGTLSHPAEPAPVVGILADIVEAELAEASAFDAMRAAGVAAQEAESAYYAAKSRTKKERDRMMSLVRDEVDARRLRVENPPA